jgi:hypothetical protein
MKRSLFFFGAREGRITDLGIMTTKVDLTHLTSVRQSWLSHCSRKFPALSCSGGQLIEKLKYLYNCTYVIESRNGDSHRHVGDTGCRGP